MPPQAAMKSFSPGILRSGVQGEWSDTIMSMSPASTASHSLSCEYLDIVAYKL